MFALPQRPQTAGRDMKEKLHTLAAIVLVLAIAVSFAGCNPRAYTQTIKITAEAEGVNGLLARIEYYQDSKLVSSINLIDGDGDGIIDGKSGPTKEGQWPKGWRWFDELYSDVIVGHSTIEIAGEKIRIQTATVYEFLPGEYECEAVG